MSMNEFLSAVAQFFGYILPVVGVIALVYLALLFKKLIETLKAVDKTLTIVDSQVQKLDQPLETVANVSKTVDDANTKVREMAVSTSKSIVNNSEKLKSWVSEKKENGKVKESTESMEEWLNDTKNLIKDGVGTLGDTLSDTIQSKKDSIREYPVIHEQEDK